MLKLVGHVAAPPQRLVALIEDVESWPRWMAGVRRVEVLERLPGSVSVCFWQRQFGRDLKQRMTLERRGSTLHQTQHSALLDHWRARWRFVVPPDGRGTTLSMAVDLQLAGLGRWLPEQVVRKAMDAWFAELLRGLEETLSTLPDESSPPGIEVVDTVAGWEIRLDGLGQPITVGEGADRPLIEIWNTPRGLEIACGGRRWPFGEAPPSDGQG